MAKKPVKTGKALEKQVTNAYRAMGAWKVEHDVELAGHQIDVYVELGTTADHSLHRIAVEAKDYKKPVGIKIVSDFGKVVKDLRDQGHIRRGGNRRGEWLQQAGPQPGQGTGLAPA